MKTQTIQENPIQKILLNRAESREKGIYSCCSANEYVIRAAMRRAKESGTVVLIEATANQVNQYGGYTGMTPERFREFVLGLAKEEDFSEEKLFLGGDHLGPLTWQHLSEKEAMEQAKELVRAYVLAGFSKIHIDTSMRVADDDPSERLSDAVIARRGAMLCQAAEEAFAEYAIRQPFSPAPVYVIGSEVPIPGGAQENEDSVLVTTPEDCEATLMAFNSAFKKLNLEDAWKRVIAIVVQPGVEFADESVVEYDRSSASPLTSSLNKYDSLVFEGHSTDYQPPKCLKEMVEDGIAILKVGPALTFALREGIFALEQIEQELAKMYHFVASDFRWVLEQVMLDDAGHWKKYYHGNLQRKRYARAYSFSDRSRYYLTNDSVQKALTQLLNNLDAYGIPLALLSQYMPRQYAKVRSGQLELSSRSLLVDRVGDCIDDYLYAILKN